jgi:hypothetical protein
MEILENEFPTEKTPGFSTRLIMFMKIIAGVRRFGETSPHSSVSKSKPSKKQVISFTNWRTETDPVSETSCSLEYQTMEKVQKPSNSVYYTPSSEPFRIYK